MAPRTENPNRNSPQASHTTTVLLFLVILIAFFPGIFHYLWTLPLALLPASLTFSNLNPLTTTPPPITDTTGCNSDPNAVAPQVAMGSWFQKQFTLPSKSKGSYLVTDHVVDALPELKDYKVGILHLFVQHTSCALSLNENYDDDVRADMSDALDRIAPEQGPKGKDLYRHSAEGPDDMPAVRSPQLSVDFRKAGVCANSQIAREVCAHRCLCHDTYPGWRARNRYRNPYHDFPRMTKADLHI